MTQTRIFVSHSYADKIFAAAMVQALQHAGADVWYDEHNLGAGVLLDEITRELQARSAFIVLLSKYAFASTWVRDECKWAYGLYTREPTRIILPVTAQPIDASDFSAMLFMDGFKRIEAPGHQPYPVDEAIRRTLQALALVPKAEVEVEVRGRWHARDRESVEDLLTFGKALAARRQYAEATKCFERVTELAPDNVEAWANMGYAYDRMQRWRDAAMAYRRALRYNQSQGWVWFNLSSVERSQGDFTEALAALNQVINLDPRDAVAWWQKGDVLTQLGRDREALGAYERARVLDPNMAGENTY